MKFTSSNIKLQEFGKSLRGYDKEEVRVFLEKIADDYDDFTQREKELLITIDGLNLQINEFKQLEKRMRDNLLSLQEKITKSEEDTKAQAASLLKDAEIKSMQMVLKADEEAELIRNSVFKLKEERKLLIARLKSMIESQSEILLGLKEDTPKIEFESNPKIQSQNKMQIDIDDILEKLI